MSKGMTGLPVTMNEFSRINAYRAMWISVRGLPDDAPVLIAGSYYVRGFSLCVGGVAAICGDYFILCIW